MAKRQASESENEYNDDHGSSGSESDNYLPSSSKAPKKIAGKARPPKKKTKRQPDVIAIESDSPSRAVHGSSTHTLQDPTRIRAALLKWYSGVHDTRGMPWRKPYDPSLGKEERAQRAYEVSLVFTGGSVNHLN